jgi:hypothetical protein
MISELKRSEFHRCKELITEKGLLETKAVIEGNHPGRIFVDDTASPASGIIWLGSNNGFIFIGDEQNAEFNAVLPDFFTKKVQPDFREAGYTAFEAIGHHPRWDKTFLEVFGENVIGYHQRVYELQKDHYRKQPEPVVEKGYEVVQISCETLDVPYNNVEFLQSKVLEFWPSLDAFLTEGMGYMVVYENDIACVCFSGVVAGNIHGIDIETVTHHQGKKLAQTAARAFVKAVFVYIVAFGKIPKA